MINDPMNLEQWQQEPRAPADVSGNPVAERLNQALAAGESLTIRYFGGSEPGLQRRIRPLELYERAGMLYLDAYCESRGETRCFKICRIEIEGINKLSIVEDLFEPEPRTPVKTGGSGCLVMLAALPGLVAALKALTFLF